MGSPASAGSFHQFRQDLFAAHLVLGEDLEDAAVIDRHARGSSIDLPALHAALSNGSADEAVTGAEIADYKYGVQGAPAWLLAGRLTSDSSRQWNFQRLAENAAQVK